MREKHIAVFTLFIIFTLVFLLTRTALCDAQAAGDGWMADKLDERKALRNVTTPPERLEPLTQLTPLDNDEGIIRSVSLPDGEKFVALTFDLCELETVTTGCDMEVLNFLRNERIPATLFMGGKWMRTHARRVKQIMTEPLFEIGNHAWSHGNFALLSPKGRMAQALWTQAQYELLRKEVLSEAERDGRPMPDIPPVPLLFRFPYARSSEAALRDLAGMGFRIVLWDVAAEAGDNRSPKRAKASAKRVAKMTRPGSILLFHANLVPKGTAQLVKEVVAELKSSGYGFVTAGQLLGMGEAVTTRNGYFTKPGDNIALDKKFGPDGTGRKTPRTDY